jgi:hypothetical protein
MESKFDVSEKEFSQGAAVVDKCKAVNPGSRFLTELEIAVPGCPRMFTVFPAKP